jgi:hypothetical protein
LIEICFFLNFLVKECIAQISITFKENKKKTLTSSKCKYYDNFQLIFASHEFGFSWVRQK